MLKRDYGVHPIPTYYCEYHARSFPIAATFVSRTGFAVHTDDRHIMRKVEMRYMTLRYVSGDLFSTSAQVLVIPVNCQGVAGRGVALQAKQRFPKWFETYQSECLQGGLRLGFLLFGICPTDKGYGCFLNFPTKGDWRRPSKLPQ